MGKQQKYKSFEAEGKKYTISLEEEAEFRDLFPDAKEVLGFKVGRDTMAIAPEEIAEFKDLFPEAEPIADYAALDTIPAQPKPQQQPKKPTAAPSTPSQPFDPAVSKLSKIANKIKAEQGQQPKEEFQLQEAYVGPDGRTATRPQGAGPKKATFEEWKDNLPSNLQGSNTHYDLEGAFKSGAQPELSEDGFYHLPSRDPKTGLLLKKPGHPTFGLMIDGEEKAGYEVYTGKDGRLYSRLKTTSKSGVLAKNQELDTKLKMESGQDTKSFLNFLDVIPPEDERPKHDPEEANFWNQEKEKFGAAQTPKARQSKMYPTSIAAMREMQDEGNEIAYQIDKQEALKDGELPLRAWTHAKDRKIFLDLYKAKMLDKAKVDGDNNLRYFFDKRNRDNSFALLEPEFHQEWKHVRRLNELNQRMQTADELDKKYLQQQIDVEIKGLTTARAAMYEQTNNEITELERKRDQLLHKSEYQDKRGALDVVGDMLGGDLSTSSSSKEEAEKINRKIQTLEASKKLLRIAEVSGAEGVLSEMNIKTTGATPEQKLETYYQTLIEAINRNKSKYGFADDMSIEAMNNIIFPDGDGLAFADLLTEAKALAPVVLLQRMPVRERQGAGAAFGNAFLSGLVPIMNATVPNTIEQANRVNTAINEITGGELDQEFTEAMDVLVAPDEMFSAEDFARMAGSSSAIMLQMIATRSVYNSAAKTVGAAKWMEAGKKTGFLNGEKAWSALGNTKFGAGLGRALFKGVEEGTNFALTGEIFKGQEDEMTFWSGFFGSALASPVEDAMSAVGKEFGLKQLHRIFGDQSEAAIASIYNYGKILEAAGKNVSRGIGEIPEEFGNEIGNIYRDSENWQDFKDKFNERFPTSTEATHLAVSSFVMGAGMGMGSSIGSYMAKDAKTRYEDLSDEEKKVFKQVIADLGSEMQDAFEEAGADIGDEVYEQRNPPSDDGGPDDPGADMPPASGGTPPIVPTAGDGGEAPTPEDEEDNEWEFAFDPLESDITNAKNDLNKYEKGDYWHDKALERLEAIKNDPISYLETQKSQWKERKTRKEGGVWDQEEIDAATRDIDKKIAQLKAKQGQSAKPTKVSVEEKVKAFTSAGEQSKKEQSPKALGDFIIDNAEVGDRIKISADDYYEVVSRKTNKKGHTETELQHFVKNEETGEFENNPSAVKLFTDKYRGTDQEKLGYRDASDLFESGYRNDKGEKIVIRSTYIPKQEQSTKPNQPSSKAQAISQHLPKGGEIKGVTEVQVSEDGKSVSYGTKTNRTKVSVENMSADQIAEELAFEKNMLTISKKRTSDFNEADILSAIGMTDQEKQDAIKMHYRTLENQERVEKIVIPFYEKQLEIAELEGDQKPKPQPAPKPEPQKLGSPTYEKNAKEGKHTEGLPTRRRLADDTIITGRFKLVEAEDLLPSHNEDTFGKNEGFPTTPDGKTANDRDYENSESAKQEVIRYGLSYNEKALSNVPVVTKSGIVLDGNNRTMSRKLAAKQGTDKDYVEGMKFMAAQWGIDPADIDKMKAPTIIMETDEDLPLNTETFARFNKDDKKAQSPIEAAIAVSKKVTPKTQDAIANLYANVDSPSEVTSSPANVKQLIKILTDGNILGLNELPRYFDATRLTTTPAGVSFIESLILGTTLHEDSIRILDSDGMGTVKNTMLKAIVQLAKNRALPSDSNLTSAIANALDLIQRARQAKQSIDEYIGQLSIDGNNFQSLDTEEGLSTFLTAYMIGQGPKAFKNYLATYNENVGKPDLMNPDPKTKISLIDEFGQKYIPDYEKVKRNIESNAAGGQGQGGKDAPESSKPNPPTGKAPEEVKQDKPPAQDAPPLDPIDAEIKRKKDALRDKLKNSRGNLNMGVDPEILALVVDLLLSYAKKGVFKFSDFVKDLVKEDSFWADQMAELRAGYAAWRDQQADNDEVYDVTEDSKAINLFIKNELPKLLENGSENNGSPATGGNADGNPEGEPSGNLPGDNDQPGSMENNGNQPEELQGGRNEDDAGSPDPRGPGQGDGLGDVEESVQSIINRQYFPKKYQGVNTNGEVIIEDLNGVRQVLLVGSPIMISESVNIVPTKDGVIINVNRFREHRFMTTQEIAEAKEKPVDLPIEDHVIDITPNQNNENIVPENYYLPDTDYESGKWNTKAKIEANTAALKLLLILRKEKRFPTQPEQELLNKYSGWGGIKEIGVSESHPDWKKDAYKNLLEPIREAKAAIRELEQDQTYGKHNYMAAILENTQNAHYTPAPVIKGIYDALVVMGFKGGVILEPSSGIGKFITHLPKQLQGNSRFAAVEKDPLSAEIMTKIHPKVDAYINGFEKVRKQFQADLVIGNVPFGSYGVTDMGLLADKDRRVQTVTQSIHNYFMFASILSAKPGAMVALVTSRYTMDAKDSTVRELLNDHAEFVSAVRLPAQTFKNNANTEVVTDIIIMRRWGNGEKVVRNESFTKVGSTTVKDGDGEAQEVINSYFIQNPSKVLGTLEMEGSRFGSQITVTPDKDMLNDPEKFKLTISLALTEGVSVPDISAKDKLEPAKEPVKPKSTPTKNSTEFVHRSAVKNIGNILAVPGKGLFTVSHEMHIDPELDAKADSLFVNPTKIRAGQALPHEIEKLEANGLKVQDFFLQKLKPLRIAKDRQAAVTKLLTIRDLIIELLDAEIKKDPNVESVRDNLRKNYRSWVASHGRINAGPYKKDIEHDVDFPSVLSLEVRNDDNTYRESDILTKATIVQQAINLEPKTLQDAIIVSLNIYGRADNDFITKAIGKTVNEIIEEEYAKENPTVFIKPDGQLEIASTYLGGNVKKKLKEAIVAAESSITYNKNVNSLQEVQPKKVPMVDIYTPMGSPWVPIPTYHDFFYGLTNTDAIITRHSLTHKFSVKVEQQTAQSQDYNIASRRDAGWLFTHVMNQTDPVVIINNELHESLTNLARLKAGEIKEKWEDYKINRRGVAEALENIYNDIAVHTVPTKFDGSHLIIPGLVNFILHSHQKDAIWRILINKGGLLDHMVGAGKTLVMLGAAIEGKRMGIFSKPIISGLQAQIPQMYEEAKKAYPNAKILYPKKTDFEAKNRRSLLQSIATNDWDIIIISHEQLGMIEQDPVVQEEIINEELTIIDEMIAAAGKKQVTELQKKRLRLVNKLNELQNLQKDEGLLHMSNMGIDFLMIDEAHLFKNLFYQTIHTKVKGLGPAAGSKRAFNLLTTTRVMHKKYGDDQGILFATGTPISNSMVEIYSLFRYLRPTFFAEMNIKSLDDFLNTYATITTGIEATLGGWKQTTRLKEFKNLPELMAQYREMADVRNKLNLKLKTPKINKSLHGVEPTRQQTRLTIMLKSFVNSKGNEYRDELGLTNGYVEEKNVNPTFGLLAMGFAKKLALDPRMINKRYKPGGKIPACTNKVWEYYQETTDRKGTQLIFCDSGTPRSKTNYTQNFFNYLQEIDTDELTLEEIFGHDYSDAKIDRKRLIAKAVEAMEISQEEVEQLLVESQSADVFSVYNEVKYELVSKGIPENEIAFIHDYEGSVKRTHLYDLVNRGVIRVLMGSTPKMGVGVSVQKKIVAMHHLDMPYRPSDKAQREGRGERQGNENKEVYLEYYATNKSVDSIIYKIVSSKEEMINQIVLSDIGSREMEDVLADVNMADMAASLSGDPVFARLVEVTKKIQELENKKSGLAARKLEVKDKIKQSQESLERLGKSLATAKDSLKIYDSIEKDEKGLKFQAEHNGEPVENLTQVAEIIKQGVMEMIQTSKYEPVKILTMYNGKFSIYIKRSKFGLLKYYYYIEIKDANGNYLPQEINGDLEDDKGMGIASKVDNTIEKIPKFVRLYEDEIENVTKVLERAQKTEVAEFDQNDELVAARIELQELEVRVAEVSAAENAEAAKILEEMGDDDQFSADTDSATKPNRISKRRFIRLVRLLKKSFPNVEVLFEQNAWDAAMSNPAIQKLITPGGTVYGFRSGNKIFINPNMLSTETLLHEIAHVWEDLAKNQNKALHTELVAFMERHGKKYMDQVRNSEFYQALRKAKNMTDAEFEALVMSEAIAKAISDRGKVYVDANVKNKLLSLLTKFWNWIKSVLGMEVGPQTKIKDVLDQVVEDIVKGKNKGSGTDIHTQFMAEKRRKFDESISNKANSDWLRNLSESSPMMYDVISNKESIAEAIEWISSQPSMQEAINKLMNADAIPGAAGGRLRATARFLVMDWLGQKEAEALRENDLDTANSVRNYLNQFRKIMAKEATQLGQAIQVLAAWRVRSPEGIVFDVQQTIDEINQEIIEKLTGDADIDALRQEITDLHQELTEALADMAEKVFENDELKGIIDELELQAEDFRRAGLTPESRLQRAVPKLGVDPERRIAGEQKVEQAIEGYLAATAADDLQMKAEALTMMVEGFLQQGYFRTFDIAQLFLDAYRAAGGEITLAQAEDTVAAIFRDHPYLRNRQDQNFAQVVGTYMINLQDRMKDIVVRHFADQASYKTDLKQMLVTELLLSDPEAARIAAVIEKMMAAASDRYLSHALQKKDQINRITSKKGKNYITEMVKAINAGALTEPVLVAMFTSKFNMIPTLTSQQVSHLTNLAQAVTQLPLGGIYHNLAVIALSRYVAELIPKSRLNSFMDFWIGINYASMLSGPMTSAVNMGSVQTGKHLQDMADFFNVVGYMKEIRKNGLSGAAYKVFDPLLSNVAAWMGIFDGEGLRRWLAVWQHGSFDDKYVENINRPGELNLPELERQKFGRHRFRGALMNPYNWAKFSSRNLNAQDEFMTTTLLDRLYAVEIRKKLIEKGLLSGNGTVTSKFSWSAYKDILNAITAIDPKAKTDAANEGMMYTALVGKDAGSNVEVIRRKEIEQQLRAEAVGLSNQDQATIQEAAAMAVFRGFRHGVISKIATQLARGFNSSRLAKIISVPWVPFTRIVANVFEFMVDSVPVYGLLRYGGYSPSGMYERISFATKNGNTWMSWGAAMNPLRQTINTASIENPIASEKQLSRAMFGLITSTVLWALFAVGDDDDDYSKKKMFLTGANPGSPDWGDNDPLYPKYTMFITVDGKRHMINYLNIPILNVALAMIGNYNDYKIRENQLPVEQRDGDIRLMMAALTATPRVLLDFSFIEGVKDIFETLVEIVSVKKGSTGKDYSEESDVDAVSKVQKLLLKKYGGMVGNLNPVPTSTNLVRQMEKFYDQKSWSQKSANSIVQYSLGIQQFYSVPNLDLFGDPVESFPGETFLPMDHYLGTKAEDEGWQFISSYMAVPTQPMNIDQSIKLPDGSEVLRKFTEDEMWMMTYYTGQKFREKVSTYIKKPDAELEKRKNVLEKDGAKGYNGIQMDIRERHTESRAYGREQVKKLIKSGKFTEEFEKVLEETLNK